MSNALEFISSFDLQTDQWIWVLFCALCVGMAKTGLGGLGMLVVPILASIFGPKASTGILLPMLIMADIYAVVHYHRHADIKILIKLAPATIAGVLIAVWIGDIVNDNQFGIIMATLILIGLVILLWRESKKITKAIPHNWAFASTAGIAGGFTTMIGNAAGSIMSIYFLSLNLTKNNFIGTGAWFFLIVNLFKVPFHILVWETMSTRTLLFDLLMLPLIMLGAFLGVLLVKLIPEKPYRIFVVVSAALAALKLFF